jgi:hypothetical protein
VARADITVAVGTGNTGAGEDASVADGHSIASNGGAASFKGGDGIGNGESLMVAGEDT